ncbi:hypothetical protein P153DRAFT_412442, partial [Dothidotthia symphoricarpi CBS 119687]
VVSINSYLSLVRQHSLCYSTSIVLSSATKHLHSFKMALNKDVVSGSSERLLRRIKRDEARDAASIIAARNRQAEFIIAAREHNSQIDCSSNSKSHFLAAPQEVRFRIYDFVRLQPERFRYLRTTCGRLRDELDQFDLSYHKFVLAAINKQGGLFGRQFEFNVSPETEYRRSKRAITINLSLDCDFFCRAPGKVTFRPQVVDARFSESPLLEILALEACDVVLNLRGPKLLNPSFNILSRIVQVLPILCRCSNSPRIEISWSLGEAALNLRNCYACITDFPHYMDSRFFGPRLWKLEYPFGTGFPQSKDADEPSAILQINKNGNAGRYVACTPPLLEKLSPDQKKEFSSILYWPHDLIGNCIKKLVNIAKINNNTTLLQDLEQAREFYSDTLSRSLHEFRMNSPTPGTASRTP